MKYNDEGCKGKVAFSKRGAESFIKGKKMSRVTKKKLRVYYCDNCTYYHLTSGD